MSIFAFMFKKRILFITFFTLAITFCRVLDLSAQNYPLHRNWDASLAIGATNFYGDLSDKKNSFFRNTPFHKYYYQHRQPIYEFGLTKDISPFWSVRGNLLYGGLTSSSEIIGQYFEADLFEYHLAARFNLSNIIWGTDLFRNHTIYASLGIGFTNWNVIRYDLYTHQQLGSNGFWKRGKGGYRLTTTETVIPFGIGYAYKINKNWSFRADGRIHGINTDKLDDYYSDRMKVEGYGSVMVGLCYSFDVKAIHFQSSRPKFTGRSNEPALKGYNKRKRVIMTTPQHKSAVKKRYSSTRRSYWSIFNIFGRRRLQFAK